MKLKSTLLILMILFGFCTLIFWGCSDSENDEDELNIGLSPEVRGADFTYLVHLLNKYYGPLQWKEELFGVDLMAIASEYRERILNTRNDQDFFETISDYISLFQDAHTYFAINSDYIATLDFDVDLYDNKLIVDKIYDSNLPLQIGDELLSMNGESAQELIERLKKFMSTGFDRSSKRWATTLVTKRSQMWCPEVVSGDVVLEMKGLDGVVRTENMTWKTSGTPYIAGYYDDPFSRKTSGPELDLLERLQRVCLPSKRLHFLSNWGKYGQKEPIFNLPENFQQRLGSGGVPFFSGVYSTEGKTIGFVRVPSMYLSSSAHYETLKGEIIQLNSITDGLVIDVMNNGGGLTQFTNFFLQLLHRQQFPQILFEVRATLELIKEIEQYLKGNITEGERVYLEYVLAELYEAYTGEKPLTEPISLDPGTTGLMIDPIKDDAGNPIGYDKPVIVLVNEYSGSAADSFPATLQDTNRAKLVGYRTAGAGGTIEGYEYRIPYSESGISITNSLGVRSKNVHPEGYPETRYIENVGVHPDYFYDYQNMEDLFSGGQNFVTYFTEIILQEIQS